MQPSLLMVLPQSTGVDSLAPPASTESPTHASSINSKASAASKGSKQQFSFSNGMDDKLFEKLSNKLLPVDESRHDMRNVVTASDYMNSARLRSSGSNNVRKPTMSAGHSPRCAGWCGLRLHRVCLGGCDPSTCGQPYAHPPAVP